MLSWLASWTLGLTIEICDQNAHIEQEHCPQYNLLFGLARQIIKLINDASVLITALATAVMAGFTGTLWRATAAAGEQTKEIIKLTQGELALAKRQAVFARQQLKLLGAQTDILMAQKELSRQQFLVANRPRVIVKTIKVPNDAVRRGGVINTSVVCLNVGVTKAKITEAKASPIVVRKYLNKVPEFSDMSFLRSPWNKAILLSWRRRFLY